MVRKGNNGMESCMFEKNGGLLSSTWVSWHVSGYLDKSKGGKRLWPTHLSINKVTYMAMLSTNVSILFVRLFGKSMSEHGVYAHVQTFVPNWTCLLERVSRPKARRTTNLILFNIATITNGANINSAVVGPTPSGFAALISTLNTISRNHSWWAMLKFCHKVGVSQLSWTMSRVNTRHFELWITLPQPIKIVHFCVYHESQNHYNCTTLQQKQWENS